MKARRELKERRTELKKEIKHDCPTDMIFSDKKGRCVNPNLENLNLRSKSAPNLRFKKIGGDYVSRRVR